MNKIAFIGFGAAVTGIAIWWTRRRYLLKKARKYDGTPMADTSDKFIARDELADDTATTTRTAADTIIQDAAEQKLTKKPKRMIPKTVKNFENKKKTQPLLLLNEIFICLNYTVTVVQNPPPEIMVECVIEGETFSARAPTKKAAQREIALKALDFFFED